ncbi:MAG: 1-acyl-sn-glycerol-3-phosphate acyltransferase [Polyangiaceae bacterium]|nr:1-acyl-sn-glycerol-3-phosphate acyltransferase [Polyangiaceae bacterium]
MSVKPYDVWRAAKQWVPFAAKTMAFATISITAGPLTPDRRASLWAMRRWSQSSTKGLNIKVEVDGLENVPEGAFVYASNHQSIVDIIVLGGVLPGDYKWAARRSLLRVPFLGWHLALAGHVPVDRGAGSRAAAQVIERFVTVVKSGKPLLVFPEGTRTPTGGLKPFKNGGFYASVRTGVPVVPVALQGTFDLMRRGASDTGEANDRIVRVRIGKPITPKQEGREGARVANLRDQTFAAVSDLLVSIGGRVDDVSSVDAPATKVGDARTAL